MPGQLVATMLRTGVGTGIRIIVPAWHITTFVAGAGWRILAHADLIPLYAPKSRRRSAAALPKIRMPKTTMMAVDN